MPPKTNKVKGKCYALTAEQILCIKEEHAPCKRGSNKQQAGSITDLAYRYGVARHTISRVLKGTYDAD